MATLTILNPVITIGGAVSFTFTGMMPEWYCYVGVVGGGYANFSTGDIGSGEGTIGPLSEGLGNYTLRVWDDFGNEATAPFTIAQEIPSSEWVLVDKVASTLKYEVAVFIPEWILVDRISSTLKYQTAVVVPGWVLVDKVSSTLKAKGVIPPPPPDGEGEIPWGPIAIGVGAVVVIVAAIAGSKAKVRK